MVGVSERGRVAVWAAAVLAAGGAVGLGAVAVAGDLDAAGQAASIVGALVGLVGVVISVLALNRAPSGSEDAAQDGTGGGDGGVRVRVRAGRGGIAAGGDISGNAVGDRSEVSGQTASARPTSVRSSGYEVRADPGAVAAGGNVTDNALGDDSRR